MKTFQLSEQLLNAVIAYLGTRPYQEVYQLIAAIQAVAEEKKDE